MSVAALETDDPRALLQRVGKDELKAGKQGAINTGWPTEKALGILTSAVIGCFGSVDNSDAYKAQYRWLEKLEQEAVAPDGPAPTPKTSSIVNSPTRSPDSVVTGEVVYESNRIPPKRLGHVRLPASIEKEEAATPATSPLRRPRFALLVLFLGVAAFCAGLAIVPPPSHTSASSVAQPPLRMAPRVSGPVSRHARVVVPLAASAIGSQVLKQLFSPASNAAGLALTTVGAPPPVGKLIGALAATLATVAVRAAGGGGGVSSAALAERIARQAAQKRLFTTKVAASLTVVGKALSVVATKTPGIKHAVAALATLHPSAPRGLIGALMGFLVAVVGF